jgi:hypothetical protein
MPSTDETVAAYAQAWNEPDEAKRRKLLEAAWAADGTYTDPTAHVEGRAALVAHIAGFHQQMPGARIRATSGIDVHHGRLRFTWAMDDAHGAVVVEGIDFGELAPDGRLARIVGFFGPPPAT